LGKRDNVKSGALLDGEPHPPLIRSAEVSDVSQSRGRDVLHQ